MKKFFLNALSSFVGTWVALILAGLVTALIIFAVVTRIFGQSLVKLEENSVLEIKLEGTIIERESGTDFSIFSLLTEDFSNTMSLSTLETAIKEAKENKNIKAIYIDCGSMSAAPATLQALRASLIDFKSSGKKIYAYADYMTQGAFYVASVADEIALNPAGGVSFSGMGGTTMFYKGFFDKIGLSFQAVRVGKGKAAVEPFTQDTMSSVARTQNIQLMDTLWNGITRDIAKSRSVVTPQYLDSLINIEYISQKPASYILEAKIVDRLEYRHAFEERIAKAVGQGDELNRRISPSDLAMYADHPTKEDKNQVAVLYACGGIDDVMGGGGIDSEELVKSILELKNDDNVKALVLRVNSPGGSAFGSEQIWEALNTFKKSGKPYIVSMGDYAASGGYYISAGADRIFANPLCITGSIGIFGLIPNVEGLMKKLGLNTEMVATNPSAQFPNLYRPLDEKQYAAMQSMVEDGYDLFVKRCAEGRNMSVDKIKEIADGRPLAASVAKYYGLVDELGNLDDAVKYAAQKAKLKEYVVVSYPEVSISLKDILSGLSASVAKLTGSLKLFSTGDVAAYAEEALSLINSFRPTGLLRAETALFKPQL